MQYTVYVGTLTTKRGKSKPVSIHFDRGYVWDQIFEFVQERQPREEASIFDLPSSKRLAMARKYGYEVHRGTVMI